MSNQKFTISLNIENIGPHFGSNRLSLSKEVDSNKCIFYATNGTGKSFISKTFRLTETPDTNTDDLLTIGKNKANFSFDIKSNNTTKQLSIVLEKNKGPVITNTSGLLFHTFNSDFVEENIKPRHYTPNGDIEGYILGKAQIDLTSEKAQESNLVAKLKTLNADVDEIISKARADLRHAGVQKNMNEMALIVREQIEQHKSFDDIPLYREVLAQLDKLKKVPETLADISIPKLDFDTSCLDNIAKEFATVYPKSEWDEEFVRYYKENRLFLEGGLDKMKTQPDCCPFCQRPFDKQALLLIKRYLDYRNNQEAKTIAILDS